MSHFIARSRLSLLLATALVGAPMLLPATGCGAFQSEPLPDDKQEYAGHWVGDGWNLTITKDGGVSWEEVEGGGKSSLNGPIKSYDGDDFTVGVLGIETTFHVEVLPHEDNGEWKMTVDGHELTRVSR